MKIQLKTITIRELVEGYVDKQEEGVRGYGGRLNIRPAYQREFIYKEKQREAVIHTVRRNFPLNTMYWAVSTPPPDPLPASGEGEFELMDGQQRTISICQYVAGDFAITVDGSPMFFGNLTAERQKQILDYELSVYVCEGTDQEKLDWFKIINIAGEKLTDQELRNAIYTGPWLADAKRWFSKTGCPAYAIGEKYVNGSPIRQDFLETALEWISGKEVEKYMADHQHYPNASELWIYFQAVITWVQAVFPKYRREMKGVEWGYLYNQFSQGVYDANALEEQALKLIDDDEVQNQKGIYTYLLTGDERALNLRKFDEKIKRRVYERQKGICVKCKKHFDISEMEADHITPWSEGGKTIEANCQLLCQRDNRSKGGR